MIELGNQVKDKISGLVGIAVSKTEYLNGCIQYAVLPRVKKGATEMPSWNIDQEQLEKVGKSVKTRKSPSGGAIVKIGGTYASSSKR